MPPEVEHWDNSIQMEEVQDMLETSGPRFDFFQDWTTEPF